MTERLDSRTLLSRAISDDRLTSAEWGPVKAKLEHVAPTSPLFETLLDVFSSPVKIDAATSVDVGDFLAAHGYLLQGRPRTEWARKVSIAESVVTPDADFNRLLQATGRSSPENRVRAAIMDSAMDLRNPAIRDANHPRSWDYGDDDSRVIPERNSVMGDFIEHGTTTTGVLVQGTQHHLDLTTAKIIPTKHLKTPTTPAEMDALTAVLARNTEQAIEDAVKGGVQVISLSTIYPAKDANELVAACMKRHPEVLFTLDAGNEGSDLEKEGGSAGAGTLPAIRLPNLLVVGAGDETGRFRHYSNFGPTYVGVGDNGTRYSAFSKKGFHKAYGTSLSSPSVANAAIKCKVLCPVLTPPQLIRLLEATSHHRADWTDKVMAGGPIDRAFAYQVAALMQLLSEGVEQDVACQQVGLGPAGSTRALAIAQEVAAAA